MLPSRTNLPINPIVIIRDTISGIAVLHVFGDVDIATAPELEAELCRFGPSETVVVDLSECAFIDTSGISTLVRAFQRLKAHLRIVVAPQGHIARVLDIVRIPDIMTVSTSLEESLAA